MFVKWLFTSCSLIIFILCLWPLVFWLYFIAVYTLDHNSENGETVMGGNGSNKAASFYQTHINKDCQTVMDFFMASPEHKLLVLPSSQHAPLPLPFLSISLSTATSCLSFPPLVFFCNLNVFLTFSSSTFIWSTLMFPSGDVFCVPPPPLVLFPRPILSLLEIVSFGVGFPPLLRCEVRLW